MSGLGPTYVPFIPMDEAVPGNFGMEGFASVTKRAQRGFGAEDARFAHPGMEKFSMALKIETIRNDLTKQGA